MIVKYTKAHVLTIHVPKDDKSKELVSAQIIPGNNEIEKATWTKFKAHPAVKKLIENGDLLEVGGPEKDNKKSSKGLEAYSIPEAKKIIAETYDKALLEKWAEEDGRGAIGTAVKKQLEKMAEATKPEKEESGEE